jgi:hypothetical protein
VVVMYDFKTSFKSIHTSVTFTLGVFYFLRRA